MALSRLKVETLLVNGKDLTNDVEAQFSIIQYTYLNEMVIFIMIN